MDKEKEQMEDGVKHLDIEEGAEEEATEETDDEATEEAPDDTPDEATYEVQENADADIDDLLKGTEKETADFEDKYLRLYAEFENYRKRVARDKAELIRYGNGTLLSELLPSLDNLETALKHSAGDAQKALVEGIENTVKELGRTLEKFGLKPIDALGKAFNPELHHAVAQVERDDIEENTVAEEFRKGYTYGDQVLRASMVVVSIKPQEDEHDDVDPEDPEGSLAGEQS